LDAPAVLLPLVQLSGCRVIRLGNITGWAGLSTQSISQKFFGGSEKQGWAVLGTTILLPEFGRKFFDLLPNQPVPLVFSFLGNA
jgi:hypothetical protein